MRKAFTLIELLVVLATIAVLIGLLLPAVYQAKRSANKAATLSNLRQCAVAVHMYQEANVTMPPHYGPANGRTATFHRHLLPFVGMDADIASDAVVAIYLSPLDKSQEDKGAGACNYPVNLRLYYTNGGLGRLPTKPAYPKMQNFDDGISNTLLFATKYHKCASQGGSLWDAEERNATTSQTAATFGYSFKLWQVAPTVNDCHPMRGTPMSFLTESIQVAMCDASVRDIYDGVSEAIWQAAHTPDGKDGPSSIDE